MINDEIAMTAAEMIAAANRKARSLGIEPQDRQITVTQVSSRGKRSWQIHYGPINPVGKRGGDITIDVDPVSGEIIGVTRGQ